MWTGAGRGADSRSVRRTLPLLRLDAGWLFLLAGISLVLAAAIIPSGRELHGLEEQLASLRRQEQANYGVLGAYARFVQDLEDRDPALLRRLAAAQLNMIPRGETPLLMASTVNASVAQWVESTVEMEPEQHEPIPDTLLSRWTEGGRRLWAIGAGAFMIFIGLMIAPAPTRRPGALADSTSDPVSHEAAIADAGTAVEPSSDPSPAPEPPAAECGTWSSDQEEAERIGSPSE